MNRATGVMSGALKNMFDSDPSIIDYGSNDGSYKVVSTATWDGWNNLYALSVEEFSAGQEKPFVFMANSEVYYGSCKHF